MEDYHHTSRHLEVSPLFIHLFLFIVVIEVLNKFLLKAKELDLFKGLKVGKREKSEDVSHLFFMDDTLVFCKPNERSLST